ncbi:MAG: glycosyl hydrolase [Deltaproteobacteria bacterium]|nr:glycosyl hydrolase [Deltaproteobacteria bacterium]
MRSALPLFLLLGSTVLFACSGSNPEDQPQPGNDAYVPPLETGGETGGETAPTGDTAVAPDAVTDAPEDAPSSVPTRSCKTTFELAPGASSTTIEIAGEWDGFKKAAMTDAGSGKWRAELDLPKGDYGYKFVVGGTDWRLDPSHGRRKYVGGVENSRVIVGDCNVPLLRVASHVATPGSGAVDVAFQYVDGAEAKGLDVGSVKVVAAGLTFAPAIDGTSGRITAKVGGAAKGKYTFVVDARDKAGRAAKTLYVPTWVEDEAFQWNDGPMYFAFTDRFRNGDATIDAKIAGIDDRANYQGGDFAGVKKAIDDGYFDKLGVRSIWLSPVNDNTNKAGKGSDGRDYSGYHGYWPTEPRKTDDHFGSLDALRALTAAAHAHGIRVVLDLVNNQVHQDHAYVAAHKTDGWFNGDGSCVCGGAGCSWDARPVDCWFTSYLPDVDWTNTGAQDAFIDDALWWLSNADADGLRVDAVKHMNDVASTALRTEIRDQLEHGNAKYYLVGETFTGGDDGGRGLIRKYIGDNALWGQFDFPLFWSIDYAFAQMGGTMADLDAAAVKSETSYGPGALMSPFLGNHDVTRFISRAAGMIGSNPQEQAWSAPPASPTNDEPYDRAFLAFAFLLGQPGVPLIYYGDETGLPGTADPDNRRFLKDEGALSAREKKLLDRVRLLAKARGTHLGLKRGARKTLHTDGDGYVFARGTGVDLAVVAINRGTTNRSVKVTVPAELGAPDGTTLKDLLGGPGVTVTGGAIDVPFTAKGAALFVR